MKKLILAVAVMGLAAVGTSTAHAGVRFSFGFPAPVISVRSPVIVAAPPVVYAAPARIYAPPPVVYSAPAYCAPAPRVYCPPAPVVRFDFGFGPFRAAFRHGHW